MSKKKRRRQRRAPAKKQKRASNASPSLLIPVAVGVVVAAIIVGAIIALENQQPTSAGVTGPSDTAQPLATHAPPYPNVPRISLQEAQARLEQGQAVLVDVRSKESYDTGHAVGALSIPEEEFLARLDEFPRDKDVILY